MSTQFNLEFYTIFISLFNLSLKFNSYETHLISILLLFVIPVKSQTYLLNRDLIDRDRKDFLGCEKELFDFNEIEFTLSTSDLAASFDDIKDEKPKTPEYLEKLKDSLSKDSLNSKFLFEIGNYYDRIEDKTNSNKNYKAALNHIDIKFFENDSASFYGTRGLVKFKLGMQGFIEDTEKALSLNPNEEISLNFYPLYLFSNQDYKKAKAYCINRLNNNEPYPEFTIFYLILINGMEHFTKLTSLDPSSKKEIIQKHFKELIDWSSIEMYYAKINNKQVALKLKKLKMFINLFAKLLLFDKNEKGKIPFEFSETEKKQMKALESWLINCLKHKTLNEYTAYKCLGFINFCLEEEIAAITYYQNAIQVFPKNKTKKMFNTDEAYSNLLFIYKHLDKNTNYENLLLKKIEDPKVKSISDYINLSKFYLLKNQIEKTRFYISEAEKINPDQFDIYRLKAHADFVEGTDIILEGFYMNKALRLAKNDNDYYRIYLQGAIYDMYNNKPNVAFNKLSIIKNNREDCETCDRLISMYFRAQKK
jgi:hypothetical protein